jgi:flagellar M-ring protein FliF
VPTANVYKLRMELAAKGVPSGDGVGFEIFDKGQFGLSDFVQRTNYVRALQGELARTIAQLDGVRSARVMIVQPENRLLLTEQGVKPTASVFVELSGPPRDRGGQCHPQPRGQRRAGPAARPGRRRRQKGHVLSEELKQDPLLGSATSQMRYKQQVEDYLSKKVESMLLPVVGPARWSCASRPRSRPRARRKRRKIRSRRPGGPQPDHHGGCEQFHRGAHRRCRRGLFQRARPQSGQPPQARPVTTTETTRKNHTTSYEINRTLTNITRNPGSIKGVTASVFVGQRMAPLPAGAAADAKPAAQPRTPEEMQALRQIVMNALGLRLAPGQAPETLVSLQEVPFQTEPVSQQIAAIQTETRVQSWIETGSRYFAVIVALGVFYVFWRILKKQQLEPVPVELLSDMPTRMPARRVSTQRRFAHARAAQRTHPPETGQHRQRPPRLGERQEKRSPVPPPWPTSITPS